MERLFFFFGMMFAWSSPEFAEAEMETSNKIREMAIETYSGY
jgi:hypothetical protein